MIAEVVGTVLGLLFVLADLRTFTSALYQTLFGALPNTTIGVLALAVFASSALAPIPAIAGARRALTATALALATATLLATLSKSGGLDLLLAGAGLVVGTWWLALTHSARPPDRPSPLPRALPIALVVDFALREVAESVPVVDLPPSIALPVVLVAALAFLAATLIGRRPERAWTAPGFRDAIALAAAPAVLLVTETGALNGAQIAAAAGIDLVTIGAVVVGFGVAFGALLVAGGRASSFVGAVLLAAGAAVLWAHLPAVSLAGGGLLSAGAIVAASAAGRTLPRPASSPLATALALALGWVVLGAGAFAYYAFYAYVPAILAVTALVALATLVAVPAAPGFGRVTAVALALVAVIPTVFVAVSERGTIDTVGAPATFRFMTYNVHQGFSADNAADLDGLVATIAREGPEVLVLQEVVRGWMMDEQHDVLGVLAARLGMRYAFGPTIGDLYGNAILSKFPITDVRRIQYVKEPGARYQPRGALLARVAGVLVITTHLDEHDDATAVRQEQVRELLDAWGGEKPVVLAGDLNARPESLEMSRLADVGFGDLAQEGGARENTFPWDRPERRIDYVWGIGVSASQAHTVASSASDHRALVVNVTRR